MAPVASASTSRATTKADTKSHLHPLPSEPCQPVASAPSIHRILQQEKLVASQHHLTARLLAIAESFLFLRDGNRPLDPLAWENDLCSATFYATYALCVDPASVRARRLLAKCARLGGFNVVLPFSPSGSAASSTVTATHLNSIDANHTSGAQAAIFILQKGPTSTFSDVGCAREYKQACYTLGRSSDAAQVASVIASETSLGKRKDISAPEPLQPPQLVSVEDRYASQIKTDEAFEAARCHRFDEAATTFREALRSDPWNWRALTGLCDLGREEELDSSHGLQRVLDKYAEQSQALFTPPAAPTTASSDGEESIAASVVSSRPKAGEETSNKKAKVSEDGGSETQQRPTKTRASSVPKSTRAGPTASTQTARPRANGESRRPYGNQQVEIASRPASQIASRALSNARTITNQPAVASNVDQDEKSAVKGVARGRITRNPAGATLVRATGMQLRSATTRSGVSSRTSARSAAPSQASSVASATSTSTSRSTTSTTSSRSGLSGRRTPATSQATSGESTGGRSTAPAKAGTAGAATTKTAVPASRTTATSRWATQANGPTAARAPVSAASRRAAAAEEAAQKEAAKVRAEIVERQRAAALETAKGLANWLAADLALFGLVRQLGEAYRQLRRFDGESAVAELAAELKSYPTDGATSGAEEKKATQQVSDSPLARCWRDTPIYQNLLGRAYNEMAQYAKAEVHFGRSRRMNPFVLAHMDVFSLVLFQLNREVALAGLAQELTLIDANSATTQIVIGNAFALQRENQTALVSFQRAAAMAPDYAYAYTLAGHEAHDLGHHDQAIAYFRSAIRCDRRHWNAWAGLGRVFLGMGGHELPACKSLQHAISLNPKNHVLWDLVGWTFAQIGKKRSALEAYDKAIALAPTLAVLTYLRRSELLALEGKHEAAHADLVRAFDLAPEEATIHLLLAQSYMRLGDGTFCELEDGGSGAGGSARHGGSIKASGQMRLPVQYQAEITHHLAVAVDLDPALLKVVKALGEGWRTNPGNRIAINPAELSNTSAFEDRSMDYSEMSGEVLEDVEEEEEEEVESASGHEQQL